MAAMGDKVQTLDQISPGQVVVIHDIPDDLVRVQALRFGIGEGSAVICREVLPGGPVVLKRGFQEIAIGRRLARSIRVRPPEANERADFTVTSALEKPGESALGGGFLSACGRRRRFRRGREPRASSRP